MLRRDLIGRSVRSSKNDRDLELPSGHIQHLRGMANDLVRGEDRKIPRHKFDHRPQSGHRSSDTDSCKSKLGDRGIDNALVPELLPEATGHFIRSIILGHLFAHDEDIFVSNDLFAKRLVQRVPYCKCSHLKMTYFFLIDLKQAIKPSIDNSNPNPVAPSAHTGGIGGSTRAGCGSIWVCV